MNRLAVAAGGALRPADSALAPLPPGRLLTLRRGGLVVAVAPDAGGRIAQIRTDGLPWLIDHADSGAGSAIAWGCYPMVPWAGRIRAGRFQFAGRDWQLPVTLGPHAIHGVGFQLPWQRQAQSAQRLELSLTLPSDDRWPFGGTARQCFELGPQRLRMTLLVTAGSQAMPVTLGWHPWFLKPARLSFAPDAMYPRDRDGITTMPAVAPAAPPWDDCFLNTRPITLERSGWRLTLRSACQHWVVYDQPVHATCIEPQSGPPDAFNLAPDILEPGMTRRIGMTWEWG